MADANLPLEHDPGEVILDDVGGWISGSCISFDDVPADEVRAGDRLLLDDGVIGDVDDVTYGDFWMNTGNHAPGVAIGWQESDGSASGTLFRAAGDELHRVRGGAR